jgi:hypothetical protein
VIGTSNGRIRRASSLPVISASIEPAWPQSAAGQPTTLVTYRNDPREVLAMLSSPSVIIIDGIRIR